MKRVKCPQCFFIKEVEDDVIISICPACMVEMEFIKHG